jgi:hypothetical protein
MGLLMFSFVRSRPQAAFEGGEPGTAAAPLSDRVES